MKKMRVDESMLDVVGMRSLWEELLLYLWRRRLRRGRELRLPLGPERVQAGAKWLVVSPPPS